MALPAYSMRSRGLYNYNCNEERYVRPLLYSYRITYHEGASSDNKFSFQPILWNTVESTVTDRVFHVTGPETAKLRGPYRTVERPSVCPIQPLLPVCCCGPAAIRHRSMHGRRSAAAAAALQHDMQQQMRGVPRCQLTQEVFVSDGPQDLEWWHRFRPVRPSVRAGRSILRRACEVAVEFF